MNAMMVIAILHAKDRRVLVVLVTVTEATMILQLRIIQEPVLVIAKPGDVNVS